MEKSIKNKDITSDLLETINLVDGELTQIFYELMSNDVSLKKKMLLRDKTILLIKKAYNSLMESIDKTEEEINYVKVEKEKVKKLSLLSLIIKLVSFCFLFFNTSIFFIIQIVGIGINHYAMRKRNQIIDDEPVYSEELVKKINDLNILIGNCSRRLSLDVEVCTEKDSEELLDKMDQANNIINDYITNNIVPNDIEETTKEILIKMLKKDLKIESDDLIFLLEQVRKKVKEENFSKKLTN